MKVIKSFAWDFYKNDNSQGLDEEKVGKWNGETYYSIYYSGIADESEFD